MELQENANYVHYHDALVMTSKSPTTRIDACVVSTKDYVFLVPKKSTGEFILLETTKKHNFFNGVPVQDGVAKMVQGASSVEELENSFKELLENDDKYVHKVADKKSFKFRGFLGKHTLRMSTGGMNWTSAMPTGKGVSKEFRAFHGQ